MLASGAAAFATSGMVRFAGGAVGVWLADLALFRSLADLASRAGAYVTGQVLYVDGGQTAPS